ncbi:MAG: hypothetical protein Kow001_09010 [Acidobacteriota bacterium]
MRRLSILRPLESASGLPSFRVSDLYDAHKEKVLTLGAGTASEAERWLALRLSCRHPRLVPVTGIGVRGRRLGLLSDPPEIPPVDLERNGWQLTEQLSLAIDLIHLMQFLHSRGVVAGILTPRHLLGRERRLECLDLVWPTRYSARRRSDEILRYAAPELWETGPSAAADGYSLGTVLYQLFTGLPPYSEAFPDRLPEMHCAVELKRPRSLHPDLPDPVEQAIRGLTRKDPQRRLTLQTAAALLASHPGTPEPRHGPELVAPLIGRDQQVEEFRGFLQRWLAVPRPNLLAVMGMRGIGKTALLERMELCCAVAGIPVLRVRHRARNCGVETLPQSGLAGFLAGAEVPPEGVVRDFRLAARERPLAVFVENLRLAGGAAVEGYTALLRSQLPVLIVAEARTQEAGEKLVDTLAGAVESSGFRKLVLSPLSQTHTEELVRQLLAPKAPDRLPRLVERRSGGNPGYVMAVLRELLRRGELCYRGTGWTWSGGELPAAKAMFPETALRSAGSILESLTPPARDLLEYLIFLQEAVSLDLLARLSSREPSAVEEELRQLAATGLIQITGTIAQPLYSASQPWLADALKAMSSPESQQEKKAKVLWYRSIENQDPLEIARLALELGEGDVLNRHFFAAIDELSSRRLYRQAFHLLADASRRGLIDRHEWTTLSRLADAAFHAGELDQCLRTVQEALTCIMNSDQQAFLLLVLARVHLARGASVEAAVCLRRAHQLAPAGSELKLKVLAELLAALSRAGIGNAARRVARQVISLLKDGSLVSQRDGMFQALYHFVTATRSNLSEPALYWVSRSVRAAARHRELPPQGLCLLARHHLRNGNWKRGLALTERLAELSSRIENPTLEAGVLTLKALAARKRGLHGQAEGFLRRALESRPGGEGLLLELHLELARNACHQLALDRVLVNLEQVDVLRKTPAFDSEPVSLPLTRGWFQLVLGDVDRADDEISSLREEEAAQRDPRFHLIQGEIRLRQGDFPEALAAAAAARQCSGRWPWYLARSRLLQAEIAFRQDRLTEAAALARGALHLSQAAWSEPLQSRAQLLKARCHLKSGNLRAARAHGLRAWQLARAVERAGLKAEICRVLAEIALEERDLARALDWTLQALDPMEELAARFSAPLRHKFDKTNIAPLQDLLLRVGRRGPSLFRDSLSVARVSSGLRQAREVPGLLRGLGEGLARQLRRCAFGLVLSSPASGGLRLEGSRGTLRFLPDSEELSALAGRTSVIRRRQGLTRVLIPLRLGTQTEGCLYLEAPGLLSEAEADLIHAAGDLAEIFFRRWRPAVASLPGSVGRTESSRPFVGEHPLVKAMLVEARRFARSGGTVLLTGESGTGKEVLARFLHAESPRHQGPFVPVNCAALPPDLVESELFGYAQGSFTGATGARAGLFEAAHGGTLFLDEVSSMPMALQPRLLRVLQEKTTRRIGEHRERQVDVRVIAATNQDLRRMVEQGQFRADLYHRLSVLVLKLPPLRDRLVDVPLLVDHILEKLRQRCGIEVEVAPEALKALSSYSYPGNVRELENILESVALASDDGMITGTAVQERLHGAGLDVAATGNLRVESIFRRLREEGSDFWTVVRDPFLARDLCREDVRAVVSRLLNECEGSYRRVARSLKLPDKDYKRLMNFLEKHDCKVDFRLYRPTRTGER